MISLPPTTTTAAHRRPRLPLPRMSSTCRTAWAPICLLEITTFYYQLHAGAGLGLERLSVVSLK